MQANHTRKLEQALKSHQRFPVNLEWMVDVFKYKHISSLTTHLKRHFKLNVHYKRFSQEQNKRVWTYFITVDCFIGICEYVRHAARKKIATVWLKKAGVKGGVRRVPRETEDFEDVSEEEEQDEEEEVGEAGEVEEVEPEQDFEIYSDESPTKRRRIEEDDEEYQCEEDAEDDSEERAYFKEMEEEEAADNYDSDDSSAEYDSSSSQENLYDSSSTTVRPFATKQIAIPRKSLLYRSLNSSSDSSPTSSAPSSPTSSPGSPVLVSSPIPANVPSRPPTVENKPPQPLTTSEIVSGIIPEQDWSYLHLRPNPSPMGVSTYEYPTKYLAHLFYPQYCAFPQVLPYNFQYISPTFFANGQYQTLLLDPAVYGMRVRLDGENHKAGDLPNKEGQFDTNVFLSLP